MSRPNFLVIGAIKSGTTSLYYYLRQHPEVYVNPVRKESQYFAYAGRVPDFRGPGDELINQYIITDRDAYYRLFEGATSQRAIGEVGTVYLYEPGTAARIRAELPDVKLVAVLRNPIERAYSNFLHLAREGLEPCTRLEDALARESERIRANWSAHWHYKQVGFYADQLRAYFLVFGRDRLRVYLFDELEAAPVPMMQDMFRFLGADDSFVPDVSLKHNVSGIPSSRTLHAMLSTNNRVRSSLRWLVPKRSRLAILTTLQNRNLKKPPPLPPATRALLADIYRDDIFRLQDVLGRDLGNWLGSNTPVKQGVERKAQA